jgi:hypothetical protein
MKNFMTMKMKIKPVLIIFVLILQFSCSDWMELLPPEGLIREEFWKTKEDVKAAVMGVYDSFAQMDDLMFKYGEMRADLVKLDNNNTSEDDRKITEGNIYPENSLCDWSKFYKVINYCNEIIEYAPLVKEIDNTFSDYQLQGYLSEAYFMRSLTYFYLVRIFKDVPFPLEPSESDDVNFYLPKTDGNEILNHIVNDLNEIRGFATVDGYQTLAENKGRVTKAAFDALLADIALWTFDYEACISSVERIETSRKYELMPSARWFELFYPGNSLESIFEIQYDNRLNQNNRLYGLTRRYSNNYLPSARAIEIFGKLYTRELYRGEDASIKKYGEDEYIIWKYVGRAPDGETVRTGTDQNSCNWIVYRYADVLLMKAEALSQLNRYAEAQEIINDIRDRADVPSLSLANSPTAFEDAILEERALELAFEGKRWFDLLRMGRRNNFSRKSKLIEIIVKNVPSTQKRILATKLTNPLGWYFPIKDTELERNINLVQNPYYNY